MEVIIKNYEPYGKIVIQPYTGLNNYVLYLIHKNKTTQEEFWHYLKTGNNAWRQWADDENMLFRTYKSKCPYLWDDIANGIRLIDSDYTAFKDKQKGDNNECIE